MKKEIIDFICDEFGNEFSPGQLQNIIYNYSNLDQVLTIESNSNSLKIIIAAKRALEAHRNVDKVLRSVGILNDFQFFTKELAYTQLDMMLLNLEFTIKDLDRWNNECSL